VTRRTAQCARTRQGFTLVELTLTMVVGSLVILGVLGIFGATRSMERVFSARFEHATELSITQRTMRRAMLSLHVQEDAAASPASANGDGVSSVGASERAHIILEPTPHFDPIGDAWHPQRFEVVLGAAPIALDTMSSVALWARADDEDEDTLDFSGISGLGGTMRSVFELRPHGSRERIMESLGILPEGTTLDTLDDPLNGTRDDSRDRTTRPVRWTLWWRPIPNRESAALRDGGPVLADDRGTDEQIRERLAGAIRLAQNIEACKWRVFYGDEKVEEYAALYQRDLAAYIEFEILLTNGQYATWMFEIDWSVGDDPLDTSDTGSGGPGEGDADADDPQGGDGGGDGGGAGSGDDRPPRGGGGRRNLESDTFIRSGNDS